MPGLNPLKRKALRRIQDNRNATRQRHGLHFEQTGVIDLYYHPSIGLARFNYATPRHGVAWVPSGDIAAAFEQLAKHQQPRLEMIEGLFPPAFHRQLETLGLSARRYPILTYGLFPGCDQQPPAIDPAPPTPPRVAAFEAADPHAIATWLRLHREPADEYAVISGWATAQTGGESYWLAADDFVIAAGLALTIDPPLAELHSLCTAQLYRGRGLASALIRAAVALAEKKGCTQIYTICEDAEAARLYTRLGFANLDNMVIYERDPQHSEKDLVTTHEHSLAQPVSER